MKNLPNRIYSGLHAGGHVQGIAVDTAREYIYFCFTTRIVKTDMKGNFIGSVTGIVGHLGCMDFCDADGRLYASLEYKNDEIGQGILGNLGIKGQNTTGFYVAVFDVKKITHADMDAENDGVMTSVWLRQPTEYHLSKSDDGQEHRYGCSGIDGISFGPEFGQRGGKQYLYVCCCAYGDVNRSDNDCQLLLQYDISDWRDKYERPLSQGTMHRCGPPQPHNRYFVYTGNTTFGIQNFEYDGFSGDWFMAVYRGSKSWFPNYSVYRIDGSKPAVEREIPGLGGERGLIPVLSQKGLRDEKTGICGYNFEHGTTGLFSLDDGRFYISVPGGSDGLFDSTVGLYQLDDDSELPFREIT